MNVPEALLNTIKWSSRIACIIFILFMSMFAFDAFDEPGDFWIRLAAFLIHLTPSIIMTIVLALSWKRPLVGAIAFLAIEFFYLFWLSGRIYGIIAIPILVIAALFILDWALERSNVH